MAKLRLSDLPPELQARLLQGNGDLRKSSQKRRTGSVTSPCADALGKALERRYPDRMVREYRPISNRRYRIDFAFPAEKVAIEFDGYRFHGFSRAGFRDGLKRQNLLTLHGWRFLRYSYTDVVGNLSGILDEVDALLRIQAN